jgi:citrate lyase subunit beta/citryl-CoA lyase
MICMIETAVGLRRSYDIASASKRVASLCCSSAQHGDLETDLGCDWSPEGLEMMYPRAKIVVDARAAGLEHPVDGVYAGLYDIEGLIRDTTLAKRLGYKGRAIIHPSHIEEVNRIYSPTPETVAYCRGLLEAFENALADGSASVAYEGKMIDYAMEKWARRILGQAELLGIES